MSTDPCVGSFGSIRGLNELHVVGVALQGQIYARVMKRPSPELAIGDRESGIGNEFPPGRAMLAIGTVHTGRHHSDTSFAQEVAEMRQLFHIRKPSLIHRIERSRRVGGRTQAASTESEEVSL